MSGNSGKQCKLGSNILRDLREKTPDICGPPQIQSYNVIPPLTVVSDQEMSSNSQKSMESRIGGEESSQSVLSVSSSIVSGRKLEWDGAADVGNKVNFAPISTIERIAIRNYGSLLEDRKVNDRVRQSDNVKKRDKPSKRKEIMPSLPTMSISTSRIHSKNEIIKSVSMDGINDENLEDRDGEIFGSMDTVKLQSNRSSVHDTSGSLQGSPLKRNDFSNSRDFPLQIEPLQNVFSLLSFRDHDRDNENVVDENINDTFLGEISQYPIDDCNSNITSDDNYVDSTKCNSSNDKDPELGDSCSSSSDNRISNLSKQNRSLRVADDFLKLIGRKLTTKLITIKAMIGDIPKADQRIMYSFEKLGEAIVFISEGSLSHSQITLKKEMAEDILSIFTEIESNINENLHRKLNVRLQKFLSRYTETIASEKLSANTKLNPNNNSESSGGSIKSLSINDSIINNFPKRNPQMFEIGTSVPLFSGEKFMLPCKKFMGVPYQQHGQLYYGE